jgi:peptidoglycan/xylan/chitin deacetylase (PgdA/CDA1 family)
MTADRLTYSRRHRGLDHDWFIHEPTIKRAPLVWPQGHRVALWITVPIEFFPMDATASPVRPIGTFDRGYPDYWSFSNRDYGTRIGIFRIMRVLDRLGLRATAAVNAVAATRYPRVMEELLQRDWEFMASGIDMGQPHHGKLSVQDERYLVWTAHEVLTKVTGTKISGWHSPGHSQSAQTLPLLAERGFEYVTDWANDDLPYMVSTPSGRLCAMPLTYEWSDRVLLVHHNLTVEDYETQVLQAFHRLHAEAGQYRGARILSLSVSPWVLGYPHRISTLERVLTRIMEVGSVWHATGMEIVTAFKSQVPHS